MIRKYMFLYITLYKLDISRFLMEYRSINLEVKLPPEDNLKLMNDLKSLPIVLQGAHVENDCLANDDNPATVEVSKGKNPGRNEYCMEPKKGDKLLFYQDAYLIKDVEAEAPRISVIPGWRKDPRTHIEVQGSKMDYIFSIFLRAKGD